MFCCLHAQAPDRNVDVLGFRRGLFPEVLQDLLRGDPAPPGGLLEGIENRLVSRGALGGDGVFQLVDEPDVRSQPLQEFVPGPGVVQAPDDDGLAELRLGHLVEVVRRRSLRFRGLEEMLPESLDQERLFAGDLEAVFFAESLELGDLQLVELIGLDSVSFRNTRSQWNRIGNESESKSKSEWESMERQGTTTNR